MPAANDPRPRRADRSLLVLALLLRAMGVILADLMRAGDDHAKEK